MNIEEKRLKNFKTLSSNIQKYGKDKDEYDFYHYYIYDIDLMAHDGEITMFREVPPILLDVVCFTSGRPDVFPKGIFPVLVNASSLDTIIQIIKENGKEELLEGII